MLRQFVAIMMIKEYRIVMPLSLQEYNVGQLYTTVVMSKNETGGGEGIEIVESNLFEDMCMDNGQKYSGVYSYKIYHLESKAPTLLKFLLPKNALKLHEESWNAFPYCKTVLRNPGYMKENFILIIESLHLEGNTNEENVMQLTADQLEKREVVFIDIADPANQADYSEFDPTEFKSNKTGRGPLTPNWMADYPPPLMTCYKLVTIECKWKGLQNRIERMIQNIEMRLFSVFHRQLFCTIDEWYDMSLKEVKSLEHLAREDLDAARRSGTVRGLTSGHAE